MQQIDFLANNYFKSWMEIHKHGVTDTLIVHPLMLGIHMSSQIYKEAHGSNYAMIKLKGDTVVNHAIESRKQNWEKTRK